MQRVSGKQAYPNDHLPPCSDPCRRRGRLLIHDGAGTSLAPGVDMYTIRRSRSSRGSSIRIATMHGFDHILNWKLKEGSHRFPGKDGGTCINEAALVAAGFEYRPIRRVENMPECFSRPVCRL